MAQINKPDMTNIWASGGAVIAPAGSKIQTGWVSEIPPHQWENYIQNRQDNAIAYLFQRGIAEWDSTTEYFANKSHVIGSNGVLYKSVTNTVGVNPTSDSGANWLPLTAASTESVAGTLKIATTAQATAKTLDNVVITPKKMGDVLAATTLTAGNGLSGGGTLFSNRTISLGTPGTLNGNTTNNVTGESHTHQIAQATESVGGVMRIASQGEAQGLTGNNAITGARLANAMNANVLGMGQTWQDVTSRSLFTSYTNTTGRAIVVSIYTLVSGNGLGNFSTSLMINGVLVSRGDSSSVADYQITAIVPPESVYRVETSAELGSFVIGENIFWRELR